MKHWKAISIIPAVVFLALWSQLPSNAVITPSLQDSYLEREFDWAMFVEVPDSKHYFNYQGSRLHPLTKVRINVREFPRGTGSNSTNARIYEELWYHKGMPVGSRRFSQLDIATRNIGAIVVGASDAQADQSQAISNVLVRLMLDLQLKQIPVGIVIVPKDSYDEIAAGLGRYNFFANTNIDIQPGAQMGIHLRSYPRDKENYFYFLKGN